VLLSVSCKGFETAPILPSSSQRHPGTGWSKPHGDGNIFPSTVPREGTRQRRGVRRAPFGGPL
jgi:hypothetical protein